MLNIAIKKIQETLQEQQAALIISQPNRFYLTGFSTSDGFVFITKKSAVFLTDSRYIEKAKAATLILQPMNSQETLRKWIIKNV